MEPMQHLLYDANSMRHRPHVLSMTPQQQQRATTASRPTPVTPRNRMHRRTERIDWPDHSRLAIMRRISAQLLVPLTASTGLNPELSASSARACAQRAPREPPTSPVTLTPTFPFVALLNTDGTPAICYSFQPTTCSLWPQPLSPPLFSSDVFSKLLKSGSYRHATAQL
jgi:hypothetical protein